jgi:hypothetical protein
MFEHQRQSAYSRDAPLLGGRRLTELPAFRILRHHNRTVQVEQNIFHFQNVNCTGLYQENILLMSADFNRFEKIFGLYCYVRFIFHIDTLFADSRRTSNSHR